MNWQHLQAFVWLRWRLLMNQWRRAGAVNAVLMMIVSVGALVTAIPLFIGCFMLGLYVIPKATPAQLMYAWDGVIVAFLFFWGIGLVTELQRTEPLSLSKFLHLPVSVNGAFLINYVSSLLRLSLIVFVPVMLGFSLALVWTKGIVAAAGLAGVGGFSADGDGADLSASGLAGLADEQSPPPPDGHRGHDDDLRADVQLPNLLNLYAPWGAQRRVDRSKTLTEELAKLDRAAKAPELDAVELMRRQQEVIEKHKLAMQEADRASTAQWNETVRLANMVLPVGWLPLGVMAAAEGRVMPSILGMLGMSLIGAGSLWRAYRTTIGLYTGQSSNAKGRPAPAARGRIAGERPEAAHPSARSTSSGLVGTGFGRCAGGISLAGSVARGEDDVALPADHDPHFRLHALERACRYSGGTAAARRHRRDGPRALRRGAIDGQSIRLRPRRVSRVRAVSGVSAGHSAR